MKGHAGIVGNEEADKRAGWCTSRNRERSVTEGGIRAFWKKVRKTERKSVGFGRGGAMEWGRKALTTRGWARERSGTRGSWWAREMQAAGDVTRTWRMVTMWLSTAVGGLRDVDGPRGWRWRLGNDGWRQRSGSRTC